jgi:hypothetical protein
MRAGSCSTATCRWVAGDDDEISELALSIVPTSRCRPRHLAAQPVAALAMPAAASTRLDEALDSIALLG